MDVTHFPAVLTSQREFELADTIERGSVETLEAIVRSRAAMVELASLRHHLRAGTVALETIARSRFDAGDGADATTKFVGLLDRLDALARSSRVSPRKRAALVREMAEYRLTQSAIDRVLTRLDAAADGDRPSARSSARDAAKIRRVWRTSEAARREMIQANMRLVIWIARRRNLSGTGLSLPDIVQEGNIGLMRAVDKFDHRRGLRFSTYASFWIRQAINRALSNQSRTIRLPVHVGEKKRKVKTAMERFAAEHGREPSTSEIARRTGLNETKIAEVLDTPREPTSLDLPIGSEGDTKLGDLVADTGVSSAIDLLAAQTLKRRIGQILETLTPREQEVMRWRFGIGDRETKTLQEIGKVFDLSRERIRQIEVNALAKLREHAESEDLDSYLG